MERKGMEIESKIESRYVIIFVGIAVSNLGLYKWLIGLDNFSYLILVKHLFSFNGLNQSIL
jgi:hypothetical protein